MSVVETDQSIDIGREYLKDLLSLASIAVKKREEGDDKYKTHCLIKVNQDVLTIYSKDDFNIFKLKTTAFQSNSDSAFSFTLNPFKVMGLLSKYDEADKIKVSYDSENQNVTLCGKYNFPSLDPENFPSFDKVVKDSKDISFISIGELQESLKFITPFMGNDLKTSPEMTIAPILDSKIIASDKKILGMYESSSFKEGFEIYESAVAGISKFAKKSLDLTQGKIEEKEEEQEKVYVDNSSDVSVEDVLEDGDSEDSEDSGKTTTLTEPSSDELILQKSDNYFLLTSPDRNITFGYVKIDKKFPHQNFEKKLNLESSVEFKIPKFELTEKIERLSFCIDESSSRLSFEVKKVENRYVLNMRVKGLKEESSEYIDLEIDANEDLKEVSFDVSYPRLLKVLPLFLSNEIKMQINPSAFVKFYDDTDGNITLSAVVTVLRKK